MNAISNLTYSFAASFGRCLEMTCDEGVGQFLSDLIDKICAVVASIFTYIIDTAAYVLVSIDRTVEGFVYALFLNVDVAYQGVILNGCLFHLAPQLIPLDDPTGQAARVNVNDLVTEYQRIERENPTVLPPSRNPSIGNASTTSDIAYWLQRLAAFSLQPPSPRDESYYQLYHGTMQKTLKHIILELRKPEIPVEKKKAALWALAEGMTGCDPRKLEECQRQLRLLKSTEPEMNHLLLGYIQDLKEEIFLQAFQEEQFHVLNYIRREVGALYGLNMDPINLQDYNMIRYGATMSRDEMHRAFYSQYTTEHVVQGIKTRMHLEENNSVWLEHIQTKLRSEATARGENPDDPDVEERIGEEGMSFFDRNLINERGVIFLLKSLGIVVPA